MVEAKTINGEEVAGSDQWSCCALPSLSSQRRSIFRGASSSLKRRASYKTSYHEKVLPTDMKPKVRHCARQLRYASLTPLRDRTQENSCSGGRDRRSNCNHH